MTDTTPAPQLAQQADAGAAAYRNPTEHANMILDLACREALAQIRHDGQTPAYRTARAELTLARALKSAERLIR